MQQGLSDALFLTDLSDFIRPADECTKQLYDPSTAPSPLEQSDVLRVEKDPNDGQFYEVRADGSRVPLSASGTSPSISLADCLTCSGCTTTAESVLVNSQTTDQFREIVITPPPRPPIVVSISQESLLSVSNHFYPNPTTAPPLRDVFGRLVTFLRRSFGVDSVIHLNKFLYLQRVAQDFVNRKRASSPSEALPYLTTDCPGFVCYTEKTHGEALLPYLSSLAAPQTLYGRILEERYGPHETSFIHLSIAPCFDKKLEASRTDHFGPSRTKLVLTSSELLRLWEEELDPDSMESSVDTLLGLEIDSGVEEEDLCWFRDSPIRMSDYVLRYSIRELYGLDPTDTEIRWKRGSNADMEICTFRHDGQILLRFAVAYGFRNIQTIFRRIKQSIRTQNRKKCPFDFVEVKACPKGCLNGGGQISMDESRSSEEFFRSLIQRIGDKGRDSGTMDGLGQDQDEGMEIEFGTCFHDRKSEIDAEQETNSLRIEW